MTTEFMQKIAAYVSSTQEILTKQAQSEAQLNEKLASAIPSVLEVLMASGLIQAHQKSAAAESLKDPLRALEIIKAAAREYAKVKNAKSDVVRPLGSAEKMASTRASDRRPSDQAFIDKLYGRD